VVWMEGNTFSSIYFVSFIICHYLSECALCSVSMCLYAWGNCKTIAQMFMELITEKF
jgi:hypothetical protein